MPKKKLKTDITRKKEKWQLISLSEKPDCRDSSGTRTEITGNSHICVEECLGVFEYRDTYIKLKLNRGSMILCGSCFSILSFENKRITVNGKISSVEFCMSEGKK